jgi:hypothetical protein
MRDPQGKDRVALWRDKNGEGLALADSEGKAKAAFSVSDGGEPTLTYFKEGQAYKHF